MSYDTEHYYALHTFLEDDISGVLDDYGSKVDALVDSMGVTENKVAQGHVRKDLDAL